MSVNSTRLRQSNSTGALPVAVLLLSLAVLLLWPGLGMAQATGQSPLGNVTLRHVNWVRSAMMPVAFGFAGLAILGVGALAMMGKFQWGWLFAIIGAVALVAAEGHFGSPGGSVLTGGQVVGDVSRYVYTSGERTELTGHSQKLLAQTGDRGRFIMYGLAGLAAMGLGALAFFGNFEMRWLFALMGGLVLLVAYPFAGAFIADNDPFPTTISADPGAIGLADGTGDAEMFEQSEALAVNTANDGRLIAYGLAGMGVLGMAVLAMMGRFEWRWFFAVIGGLAVLGGLNEGIQYLTGYTGG